jgi:orotate phosphoribosyltransferase
MSAKCALSVRSLNTSLRWNLREICRDYIEHHCILRSPPGRPQLVNKAGRVDAWQFYLPVALFNPVFMACLGRLFWDKYERHEFQLAGCETGGALLACGLQQFALRRDILRPVIILRKEQKTYGLRNWLEGICDPSLPIMPVDDVLGYGKTLGDHAQRLKAAGLTLFPWAFVLCSIHRKSPSSVEGLAIDCLFNHSDFAQSFEAYEKKYHKSPCFSGSMR